MSSVVDVDGAAWLAAGERLRATDPAEFLAVYQDVLEFARISEDRRRLILARAERDIARMSLAKT